MQILLVLVCNLLVVSGDDKEEWIDPNDMLNYDPVTKSMRKQTAVTEFLGAVIQDLQFSVFLSFVVLTVFSILVLVYFRRSCKDPPPPAGHQPLPTSLGQQKNQIMRDNVTQDLSAQVDPLRHRKPCRVRDSGRLNEELLSSTEQMNTVKMVQEANDGFSTRSEEHVGVSVQETTPSSLVL